MKTTVSYPTTHDLRPTFYDRRGVSLMEALMAIAVFLLIMVAVYEVYGRIFEVVHSSRLKTVATLLASEQFEVIRNLPYTDVGIVNGLPPGKIPREQSFERAGVVFDVRTTIRSIDDAFDGTIGGIPNDLSPADYKLVELEITCGGCENFVPLFFNTRVAAKSLETEAGNGALFVQVIDADGLPVVGADVHVENNQATTTISIDEVTDNNGMLQIVDAPPGALAYEIIVTKAGYSTERTYESGDLGGSTPVKPHATVAAGQLTQISFSIDEESELLFSSITSECSPVSSIGFGLSGNKLIGTDPDLLKYDALHSTGAQGTLELSDMEWGNYAVALGESGYHLAGLNPLSPLTIAPGSFQEVQIILATEDPNALLVTVVESGTNLPLSGATVTLSGATTEDPQVTGRGHLKQSDWSGGGGQEFFTDETRYDSASSSLNVAGVAGELSLAESAPGLYHAAGTLLSSIFDVGTSSNFHELLWLPGSQPPEAGAGSVRFQVATAPSVDASTTWQYIGPDGTELSYFTDGTTGIHPNHNGDRYFRYKLDLSTASSSFTPGISEVAFTFTSDCIPPGQVLFSGLASGTYDVSVEKAGYGSFALEGVSTTVPWQEVLVELSPE